MKYVKSKHLGVRYKEHPTRKHGVNPDRYFVIRYQLNGKTKQEGVGWASDKWTEGRVIELLTELKKNIRTGEGPRTLAEKRELENSRREKEQQSKEKQEREAITFGQYFTETYLPTARLTKKQGTCKSEEIYFNGWIRPVIGDNPFKNIMPLQIEKLKQNLLKAGRSPRTVEYIFAIVRQVWNMAARDGLVDRKCPTAEVKKPKISNNRQRFLSREEADKLLDDVKDRSKQTYQFCLVSLHCGLRAGEIFNLRWIDINLDDGTIFIADGKGEKYRYAYMTGKIKDMFSAMNRGKPEEFVFKNRKGGKVERLSNCFQRSVKHLGLNAGVTDSRQKVVFHTLRHTFASWLVENGTDLYIVQKLMGHASFAMVQRYSHLGESTLQAAVKRLDNVISRRQGSEVIHIKEADSNEY